MRFSVAVFIGVVAFLSFSSATSEVRTLTGQDFEPLLASNKDVLVDFFAPWCGHCHVLDPEYEKVAASLKGKVQVAKLDAAQEIAIAEKFNIQAFPTVILFHGEVPIEYFGEWNSTSLLTWVEHQLKDATTLLTTPSDVSDFIKKQKLSVVGFFSDRGKEYKAFVAASQKNQNHIAFAEVFDSSLATQNAVPVPGLKFYRPFDEEPADLLLPLSSPFTEFNALDSWIKENSFPIVETVSEASWNRLSKKRKLMGTCFLSTDPTAAAEGKKIWTQVAQKHRDSIASFALSIKSTVIFEILDVNEEPVVANKTENHITVYNITAGRFYLYDGPFTFEALDHFLTQLKQNQLTYYLKSQPLPNPAVEDGVSVVVGSNFEEVVIKSDKDVLLFVYTPWDPHSQTLLPRYSSFSKENADIQTLVFAKVDGTANSLPFIHRPLMGFYFFPANRKQFSEPLVFEGEISKPEIINFVKANAGHRIDKHFEFPELNVIEEENVEPSQEDVDNDIYEENEFDSFEVEEGHEYFRGAGDEAQILGEIERIREALKNQGFDLDEAEEEQELEEREGMQSDEMVQQSATLEGEQEIEELTEGHEGEEPGVSEQIPEKSYHEKDEL